MAIVTGKCRQNSTFGLSLTLFNGRGCRGANGLSDELAAKKVSEKPATALWADWEERLDAARKQRAKALSAKADLKSPSRPKPWEVAPDPRELNRRRAMKAARNAIEKAKRTSSGQSDNHPIIPGVSRDRVIQAFANQGDARSRPTVAEPSLPLSPRLPRTREAIAAPAQVEHENTGRRSTVGTLALIAFGLLAGGAIGFVGSIYFSRLGGPVATASPPAAFIEADHTVVSATRFAAPADPASVALPTSSRAEFASSAVSLPLSPPNLTSVALPGTDQVLGTAPAQPVVRPGIQIGIESPDTPTLRTSPSSAGPTLQSDAVRHTAAPVQVQAGRLSHEALPSPAEALPAKPITLATVALQSPAAGPSGGAIDVGADILGNWPSALPGKLDQPELALPFTCDTCVSPAPFASNARISLHVARTPTGAASDAMLDVLQTAGFTDVAAIPEELAVQMSQVRFFYPEDAAAAKAVADLTDSELLDLSWFRPLPEEGVIEVWLANTTSTPRSTD